MSAAAWKDPTLRVGTMLEPHPAGTVELSDEDMGSVSGGTTWACFTIGLTVTVCSPTGTLCGSCSMGTAGCCFVSVA